MMGWVFEKTYYEGSDGYYDFYIYDEQGQNPQKIEKYGPIPHGYSGTRYADGYEGEEDHKQETRFILFRKYYSIKKNLARVNIKLSNYPEEVSNLYIKTKEHKEDFYQEFLPVIEAIKELENE